jgi:hypothetical protein
MVLLRSQIRTQGRSMHTKQKSLGHLFMLLKKTKKNSIFDILLIFYLFIFYEYIIYEKSHTLY